MFDDIFGWMVIKYMRFPIPKTKFIDNRVFKMDEKYFELL